VTTPASDLPDDGPDATGAVAQGDTPATPTEASPPRPLASPFDVNGAAPAAPVAVRPERKRPKPGERRVQILQSLAAMLEEPGADRVTTAALAARLGVSEAALYRHFASKAQMFEGLLAFIEESVFTLVNQALERDPPGAVQARRVAALVLQFGDRNPGMARVMVGDALVFEHERLSARMNHFFDRIESQLRYALRAAADTDGSGTPTADANAQASMLTAFLIGRLHRYVRSGFKRSPTEALDAALALLVP
jgi:TetR/AcrR family transcriptional regulator